jgi:serine protease inhibitor
MISNALALYLIRLLQAPVTAVTSATPINDWASKATRGLIKTAVPSNSKFKAVITNAVYFKVNISCVHMTWHVML